MILSRYIYLIVYNFKQFIKSKYLLNPKLIKFINYIFFKFNKKINFIIIYQLTKKYSEF